MGVSVQGSLSGGLYQGRFCLGDFCPRGSLSRRSLSKGVSVQGGLCPGSTVTCERYASYWNALLLFNKFNLPFSIYPIRSSFTIDPVTNINFDNLKHVYDPDEVITCAAEGNPDPEIRWVDDANSTVSDSALLLTEPSMEGVQTYSCLATNDVRGETYSLMKTVTFNVTGENNFCWSF